MAHPVVYIYAVNPNVTETPDGLKLQFDLVVHDPELDPESDPSLDPSVRFFGVDWQQVFARCFSLSINFRIFRGQVGSRNISKRFSRKVQSLPFSPRPLWVRTRPWTWCC